MSVLAGSENIYSKSIYTEGVRVTVETVRSSLHTISDLTNLNWTFHWYGVQTDPRSS